ncbi:hypothetical protein OBBRIDRAFT_581679 [Obba rivulosa]|uniref:RlpA-like protein double-psi beta-barrel domain-containing protein n=1 Tax=Obba rivulosa TaxID=1052685 RepID=A0A8E2B1W2_9APHY|nr:hypothetical protein OBBRIDRAFT_581679 [Obba rivulosa]
MARMGSVITAAIVLTALMTSHSLPESYHFDPRDGWQTVNVTNLQYKYSPAEVESEAEESTISLSKRASKKSHAKKTSKKTAKKTTTKSTKSKSSSKSAKPSSNSTKSSSKDTKSSSDSKSSSGLSSVSDLLSGAMKKVMDSFKAIGDPEKVEITWYTGHDLLNPSCWSNPTWSPTDESFACAVTENGWKAKPECFKFLELCNSPKKCVFARVVDSCAGCAVGSKHVDLTKAAFTQLANLDEGVLNVQMRPATDPDGWLEDLWGPQASN